MSKTSRLDFGTRMAWRRSLICLAIFIMSGVTAIGQLTTGTITGTVTDQSGAAIPGVTFSWSLTNQRQGSSSLGRIDNTGMLSTTGEAAALEVLGAAWQRARTHFGERVPAVWRFWSLISGGHALGTNRSPPATLAFGAGWMAPSP